MAHRTSPLASRVRRGEFGIPDVQLPVVQKSGEEAVEVGDVEIWVRQLLDIYNLWVLVEPTTQRW